VLADLGGVNAHGQALGKTMRVLHALRIQVRHHFERISFLVLQLQPLFQRPGRLTSVIDRIPEVLHQSRVYVVRDQLLMQVFEFRADLRELS